MNFLLIFVLAFTMAVLLVPISKWLSFRFDIVARPGGRRKHVGLIPMLGGVPLIGGLIAAWGAIFYLFQPSGDQQRLMLGVILGSLVVVIGGFLDDRFDLPPLLQTAVHLAGALVAIRFAVFIEVFTTPSMLLPLWESMPLAWLFSVEGDLVWMVRPLAIIFTIFWILGMVNAVNFLDGLDGLAVGVGTIAAFVFAWHSFMFNNLAIAALPLALGAALLGFLLFNFSPAKIYLGSAGAYLLGFQLATLSIISPAKVMTALLVLALPILDVAWRIFDRVRHGRSPFEGDRGHLHHLLLDNGLPVRLIVLGYYLFTFLFGVTVLWLPTPGLKIGLLLLLGIAVILILIWLSSLSRETAVRE